ncbi:MAG: hypothetical protein DRJ03_19090 [Chloroflexi bacterium]|nr:MAG: hypothetical protein DRJ03_19090 [Chloroflexota bacterium]
MFTFMKIYRYKLRRFKRGHMGRHKRRQKYILTGNDGYTRRCSAGFLREHFKRLPPAPHTKAKF